MDHRTKMADRRRYEKRGVAVKASAEGRPLSESATARLHKQVLKKYGEGWEVDAVYPGSIFDSPQSAETREGHIVMFKRRRQLRDE